MSERHLARAQVRGAATEQRRPNPVAGVLDPRAGQPCQGERRESATDVRLDGDEMTADADDGDAGDDP